MNIYKSIMIALCTILLFIADTSARRPVRHERDGEFLPGGPPMEMLGPRHGMMAPVTEEEEAAAIAFLRQFNPEWVDELIALKDTAPRWYAMKIRRILVAEAKLDWMAAKDSAAFRRNREMFRLESQAEELAMQHRQSTEDSERIEIRGTLVATLSRLFELREQEKQFEITRLEQRLDHLRKVVEERRENQSGIVERRADEMLGDRDALGW